MKPTSTFELITVNKAKALLDQNKNNRPINDANLNGIIAEMKKGNFHVTGESIKVSKNGNLLDGQHRLMAIVATGIPVEMFLVTGLDDDSFKWIDTGRTRTASDVLGIEGVKNPGRVSAMVKFIINFNRGYYFAVAKSHSSKNKERITNAVVSEYNAKYGKSIIESIPYGFNKDNKLVSGNILASFHYIFKKINSDDADDFCHKVATGEGITKENPIYLLRQKLTQDIRSTRKMSAVERLALICKTWNLYRKGSRPMILKWDSLKEAFPKPI